MLMLVSSVFVPLLSLQNCLLCLQVVKFPRLSAFLPTLSWAQCMHLSGCRWSWTAICAYIQTVRTVWLICVIQWLICILQLVQCFLPPRPGSFAHAGSMGAIHVQRCRAPPMRRSWRWDAGRRTGKREWIGDEAGAGMLLHIRAGPGGV